MRVGLISCCKQKLDHPAGDRRRGLRGVGMPEIVWSEICAYRFNASQGVKEPHDVIGEVWKEREGWRGYVRLRDNSFVELKMGFYNSRKALKKALERHAQLLLSDTELHR